MVTKMKNASTGLVLACTLTAVAGSLVPTAAQTRPDRLTIADSLSRLVDRGAVTGNLEPLLAARTLASRGLVAWPEDPLLEHYLAETWYREAARISEEDRDSAQVLLEAAHDLLDEAVDREGALAETHALLASVIGMRITNPIGGMLLGPRAGRAIHRALAMDSANPRVWLAKGIGTLHSPGFMGGGSEGALEEFDRGISLVGSYDAPRGDPAESGAELWAWKGIAHLRAGQFAHARAAFERALELEPEYGWVRYNLLPAALKEGGGQVP